MNTKQTLSRAQKRALQQQRNDVRAALQHAPTKRLLGKVLDMCGLYSYGGSNPTDMALLAGRRAVGLDLRGMLDDADPYAYVALSAEAVKAREEARSAAAAEAQGKAEDDDTY